MSPLTATDEVFTWGPGRALHDNRASAGARPDQALELTNLWIKHADTFTALVLGRPGFMKMGAQLVAAGVIQSYHQFTKVAGTERSMCVCSGELYEYNWGTNAWAKRIAAADLAAAAGVITLSATASVFCVTFADNMVVSDGINTPFAWDGTAGAGLTKLTNAPVFYGQPVVYYAKLFAIKNVERSTLVWSEEGVLNTGYEAGGYTNAWTLRQTSQEPFYALGATNAALYVARQNSTSYISGEVTPELSSFGTREGIEELGTRSPSGILVIDDAAYMATADRRVVELQGKTYRDISVGARETFAGLSTSNLDRTELALWDAGADGLRIIVGFVETGQADMTAYLCLNPTTGQCEGVWRGFVSTAIGTLRNASGERRFVHGGGSAPTTVDEGYSYVQDVPTGTIFDDQFHVSTLPISHVLETPALGSSPSTEIQWGLIDATFNAPTMMSNMTVTVTTPRGTNVLGTNLTVGSGTTSSLWNVALWDVATWGEKSGERHASLSVRRTVGRWATVKFVHAVLGERFGVSQIAIHGQPLGHRPSAY